MDWGVGRDETTGAAAAGVGAFTSGAGGFFGPGGGGTTAAVSTGLGCGGGGAVSAALGGSVLAVSVCAVAGFFFSGAFEGAASAGFTEMALPPFRRSSREPLFASTVPGVGFAASTTAGGRDGVSCGGGVAGCGCATGGCGVTTATCFG